MSNVMEYYDELGHCPSCKKIKALKILIKCCLLTKYPNGYELAFTTKIEISKEEYDLLKEIL